MPVETIEFLWQFALGFSTATLLWKRPRRVRREDRNAGLARYQQLKDSRRG